MRHRARRRHQGRTLHLPAQFIGICQRHHRHLADQRPNDGGGSWRNGRMQVCGQRFRLLQADCGATFVPIMVPLSMRSMGRGQGWGRAFHRPQHGDAPRLSRMQDACAAPRIILTGGNERMQIGAKRSLEGGFIFGGRTGQLREGAQDQRAVVVGHGGNGSQRGGGIAVAAFPLVQQFQAVGLGAAFPLGICQLAALRFERRLLFGDGLQQCFACYQAITQFGTLFFMCQSQRFQLGLGHLGAFFGLCACCAALIKGGLAGGSLFAQTDLFGLCRCQTRLCLHGVALGGTEAGIFAFLLLAGAMVLAFQGFDLRSGCFDGGIRGIQRLFHLGDAVLRLGERRIDALLFAIKIGVLALHAGSAFLRDGAVAFQRLHVRQGFAALATQFGDGGDQFGTLFTQC